MASFTLSSIIYSLLLILSVLCIESQGVWQFWQNNPWGPEDELGAVNHISPATVLRAIGTVKRGRTYNLGIVIDEDTPSYAPRTVSLTVFQPGFVGRAALEGMGQNRLVFNDDILHAWLGTGTQIDGLGHIGIGATFYNGYNATDFVATTGLTKLGLEKLPPLVGRAVILDMASYFGVDVVPEGTAYKRKDIVAVLEKQGMEIQKGDIVLFYSGWMNVLENDPQRFINGEPGLGISGAWELVSRGVVAVGADTWGVETVPPENAEDSFPAHQILITRNGIPILENINTTSLVQDGIHEFMFVLGVTRIRGAAQMMVNPVGIA